MKQVLCLLLFFSVHSLSAQRSVEIKFDKDSLRDEYAIHTLRFYISEIKFHLSEGSWQHEENSAHLIDLEDSDSWEIPMSKKLAKSSIDSISFFIGIDSLTNVSGILDGNLDPIKGMYWAWNLFDADGLYAIDSTQHSPLIEWAYDGFPIYGAYGYANNDGTGGITGIKSGYELTNYSVRTNYPNGTAVDVGPPVDATYFLGYFREDYQWVSQPTEDYLDIHNGRFSITPEFPNGIYCYFATVDENWNSAYPYAIGPTYYGNVVAGTVTTISETTTVYAASNSLDEASFDALNVHVFPNPASDLIAVQVIDLVKEDLKVELLDLSGKTVNEMTINAGSTIAYFDVQSVYSGVYFIRVSNGSFNKTSKIIIE